MPVRVAEGIVTIDAEISDNSVRRSAQQAGSRAGDSFSRGFTNSTDDGLSPQRFRRMGEDSGDALVRGADGRLRNARGQFARAGTQAGDSFSNSMGDSGSQGMQRNAGKMGGALAGAGAAFAAAGAVVGGIFVKAFADAMAQEQSVALLSARVGAFGEDSKKLGKVAGSLYADGYGESFDDVTEAIRGVKQNMSALGAAGEADLKQIAKGSMNVAMVLGEEVGPTTRAVAKMIKTGLAKNAGEAFDILTRGAQTGANEAEDLLDTFSEYSTQFRKLGLDGETAMGLISQGLQAGARDADTVADALKEFSIRAIDGSESTVEGFKAIGLNAGNMADRIGKGGKSASEALDLTLDKLRAMKDPTEREAAAVALFGTKAEDLGAALFEMDASGATKTLGEVGGAAKKAGDMLHSSLSARIERLKRTLQQGLVNMINDHVMPVIDRFSKWMKDNPQIMKPVISAVKTLALVFGGLAVVGGIAAGIGLAFSLISWPILAVVAAIAGLTLGIKYLWEHSETFRAIVTAAWDKIKEAASRAVEFFKANVIPTFVEAWESIKAKAQVLLDFFQGTLWPMLQAGWDILVAAISPIIERFKGFFQDLAGEGEGLSGVWNTVTTFIGEKVNEIWSVIQTALEAITAIWETHKGWIIPTLTFIWTTIGTIIGVALGNIWATIKGVWTAISGVISGAMQVIKGIIQVVMGILTLDWSTTWTGIKNIFGGIWKAIVSILKGAWQIIKGVFTNMWNFIKGIFLKIWDWLVGHSLIPDLVNAIVGWFRKLRDWSIGIITKMRDWVVDRFNSLKNRAVSAVTSLRDRAVGIFNNIRDWIVSRARGLRDKVVDAFNSFKDKSITAFRRARDGIKSVWNKLKELAAKPVNFVIGTVYNKGIRKFWNFIAGKIGLGKLDSIPLLKFQKGGVADLRKGAKLPGFSSKDDTLAMVRSGEGVLVPEAVQALGGAQFINRANRMKGRAGSMTQGKGKGAGIPHFFLGGIVDAVGGFIQKGKDFFKEGFVKALSGVTNPIINSMKDRFGTSGVKGLPTQAVMAIVNKVKAYLGPKAGQLEGGDGKKVVDVARSQVGYYGRPNKFTKAPGMWTDEWCGMFVDWVFKKAGASKALSGIRTPSVASYRQLNSTSKGNMKPGDLALYRGDSGHINIVTDPKKRETVGGNESNNRVAKTTGYVNSASSIRRPKFAKGGVLDARTVRLAGGLENLRDIAWQDRKESPDVGPEAARRRALFAAPPWVSRDMGGLLPDGMMAVNTSGTAEVVSTLDQLKALVASGKGATYIFNEGAITLDASKLKNIQDLVDMLDALKVTSRQFGARL